ncbi:MAG: winged helix-turn-helix transcriptional regulator [Anaerolineae bacterium]|nr:winged helix-turn-helix transcriptional regulator [Anaerolineae bacterium]
MLDEERIAALFRVLGDPTRLAIFRLLQQGTYCNCEMGEELGLSANLVSHHLKVLREAGLVGAQRHPTDARWILYSLNREALTDARRLCNNLLDPERIGSRVPASCRTAEGACACGMFPALSSAEMD